MVIVLRWYFNKRDNPQLVLPEMSGVFGPFADRETANKWTATQSNWGGWGEYQYQIEDLTTPDNFDVYSGKNLTKI